MQDNLTSLQTPGLEPLFHRHRTLPVRRLDLRGDPRYLRALRAAEMEAWRHNSLFEGARKTTLEQDRPMPFPQPTQ